MNPLFLDISHFQPIAGDWRPLESLIERAFSDNDPKQYYDAFFSVFEIHDEEDCAGVMWSAVHGMEHVGTYELILLHRFHKFPSFFSRLLLRRIYNSGQKELQGIPIAKLIEIQTNQPNKAVDSTAARVTSPASSLRSGQEPRHGQP